MDQNLCSLWNHKEYHILGGDFNIDYNSKTLSSYNWLNAFEISHNLSQIITKPTRVTGEKSSLIDLIFINDLHNLGECGVIKLNLSDHDLTFVCIKKPSIKKENTSFQFRDFKNFNIASLLHFLENQNCFEFFCAAY